MTGTIIAQVLPVLISPILSRLYAPEQFGYLTTYYAVINILGAIVCLKYELAIILPKEDHKAGNLFWLCIFCTAGISGIFFLFYLFFSPATLRLLNAIELKGIFWIVLPVALITGINLTLSAWSTRRKKFWRISSRLIINSVVMSLVQLGIPLFKIDTPYGLIFGPVAGLTVSTLILLYEVWKEDHATIKPGFSPDKILFAAREYKKFPLVETWSFLLNTLSWQAPSLLISIFFGQKIVGYYGFGYKILVLPMALIGNPLGQVFSQRAVIEKEAGNLAAYAANVYRQLVKIGLFPLLLIAIIGPELFMFFFGGEWGEAGRYAQILSVWIFFVFLSSPISSLFYILNKQEVGLLFNVFSLVTRVLAISVGGYLKDITLTLLLFSVSGTIIYIASALWVLSASGTPPLRSVPMLLKSVLPGIPFLGMVFLVQLFFTGQNLIIVAAAAITGCLYYAFILYNDPNLRELASNLILKR